MLQSRRHAPLEQRLHFPGRGKPPLSISGSTGLKSLGENEKAIKTFNPRNSYFPLLKSFASLPSSDEPPLRSDGCQWHLGVLCGVLAAFRSRYGCGAGGATVQHLQGLQGKLDEMKSQTLWHE